MQEQGKIPFFSAVLMNINVIVGVGIYFGPQLMAQQAGAMSFLGWVAAAALLFPIVWNVALAARIFPGAGGFYNYCSQGLGNIWGFIALWSYLLGFLSTAASQITELRNTTAYHCNLPILLTHAIIFNLVFVGILSLLNSFEVGLISKIQSVATILKLMPMIIVVLGFWLYIKNASFALTTPNLMQIGATIPFAIFGYWGFESCCSIAHLIKGGPGKASAVVLTAFAIVAGLYTMFHLGVTYIMGLPSLELIGVTAFPAYMGITSKSLLLGIQYAMSFVFILAFFNAAYGVMLANIANIDSLANKKLLFGSGLLQRVNRFNRPVLPIIIQCVVVWALMSFLPNQAILMNLANFGLITALILTMTAILRKQLSNKQMLPLVITALSYVSCAVLAQLCWTRIGATTMDRFMGLIPLGCGIALGLVMYYINTNKR